MVQIVLHKFNAQVITKHISDSRSQNGQKYVSLKVKDTAVHLQTGDISDALMEQHRVMVARDILTE